MSKAHKLAKQHVQASKYVKEKVFMITEKCNAQQPLLPKWAPSCGNLIHRFDPLKFGACFVYLQV